MVPLLHKTKQVLGGDALGHLKSRSLFASRYADPAAKDDVHHTPRRDWFNRLIKLESARPGGPWLPTGARMVHGRLQSRLLLNLAGGVMENANVHLDRYGWPFIPGSASKGCARRAALAALREWTEAGNRPEGALENCCTGFSEREDMLEAIALVFGWSSLDWSLAKNKEGHWKSDFAWAMNGQLIKPGTLRADDFGGSVAFLPAYPKADPGLELDVLTPHHKKYYEGKLATATDTENPEPLLFPAVKSQVGTKNDFSFPLLPLRQCPPQLLEVAAKWLTCGLEVFGLGAKTAAGYGWFDCSPPGEKEQLEAERRALVEAEEKRKQEQATAARLALASDFNEASFKGAVLDKLNKPQERENLRKEIQKLRKPENSPWVEKLRNYLATPVGKDACKKLKGQDWFPQEWLPQG